TPVPLGGGNDMRAERYDPKDPKTPTGGVATTETRGDMAAFVCRRQRPTACRGSAIPFATQTAPAANALELLLSICCSEPPQMAHSVVISRPWPLSAADC